VTDRSFEQVAILEVSRVLEPLTEINSALTVLVSELGWRSAGGNAVNVDLTNLGNLAKALIDKGVVLADAQTGEARQDAAIDLAGDIAPFVIELRAQIPRIQAALDNLGDLIGPTSQMAEKLFLRLIDYLLYEYLTKYHPRVFASLHVLGLVERLPDDFGTMVRTVQWGRMGLLFSDPVELAQQTYRWETDFNGDEFLKRVDLFMRAFMLPGGVYRQDAFVQQALHRDPGARELRIPLYQDGRWPSNYSEIDLNLSPVPARTENGQQLRAGLALYPSLANVVQVEQTLAGGWVIRLRGSADLAVGIAAELRPTAQVRTNTNIFGSNPLSSAEVRLELRVAKGSENNQLSYLFGSEQGSHLAVRQAGINLILAYERGQTELAVELMIDDLTLAINGGDGDGFIQKILAGINILTSCDLVFGYSNLEGVYFRGSGALEIEIPIHKKLGPLSIESVVIGVGINAGFEIILAASFSAELGPVSAAVKKIGLIIPIAFPPNRDGNLGPLQIEKPRFKPPTGAGLSVDAGGIVGAGFLDIDNVNKRYAGILGLSFGEIGLTAIGLIATRMPDGSDGFSLLINIGVTFDPPIQLSMGFTLAGVGGLIGLNRTMDIIVLQTGIKNRTLDSILFPDPRTVVANAGKIISDLQAVFPVTEGRFVVGPMVKIGYGTPAIITAEIGIFLDLPDPIRVVLMGQVEAMFPEPNNAIVQLHLDILGVLDFQKQELTFQASLYDSSILVFQVYGDSAFILGWGSNRRFALSLGGFHPKFTPPPPPIIFADLKRLTICISKGSNFQLSAQAYHALTPNSLQFGCRVDLYAAVSGATVTGFLGFEALIYFSPFSFEVWIGAGVCVKYQGKSIADVHLSLTLSGPGAWRARGSAKVSIKCLPDLEVDFDFQWGESHAPTLPSVNAWPRLQTALRSAGSWSGVVPSRWSVVERLRDRSEEAENQIVVHPVGQLEVRQTIVPLRMKLDKINNAPVAAYDRFDIASLASNGTALVIETVDEYFARGQFEDLSDHQRLSVPAFERMPAGVRGVSQAARFDGAVEDAPLTYDCLLINDNRTATAPETGGRVDGEAAPRMIRAKSARRAAVRAGTRARFGQVYSRSRVTAGDDRYCVAKADTLTRASEVGSNRDLTRTGADQAMAAHVASNPAAAGTLTVIPEYELQEA
jgi:hypothetical protein